MKNWNGTEQKVCRSSTSIRMPAVSTKSLYLNLAPFSWKVGKASRVGWQPIASTMLEEAPDDGLVENHKV